MIYLIGKPVAGILEGLTHWLQTMGTANAVLLGAILGGMMCTDMGGPVNKAAYAFGVGLLSTQTYGPMAAIMAAGMVPPLAMGLATMVARRKFDKAQQEGGQSRSGTGTVLYFGRCNSVCCLRDPMRVLHICRRWRWLGAISMAIGAKLMAPHGGLFVLLIPGAITPVLGLPGSNYCRCAGGGFGLCLPETSGSGRSSESRVIKGVLQGRNLLPCIIG
ncbi:fructose-specific PTS transporter subunit EIIC [Escherichia coli]